MVLLRAKGQARVSRPAEAARKAARDGPAPAKPGSSLGVQGADEGAPGVVQPEGRVQVAEGGALEQAWLTSRSARTVRVRSGTQVTEHRLGAGVRTAVRA